MTYLAFWEQETLKNASKSRALASGYRNKRSQEPDETFVMACWKWKMVFGRPKDKQKHLMWARPLRGARV